MERVFYPSSFQRLAVFILFSWTLSCPIPSLSLTTRTRHVLRRLSLPLPKKSPAIVTTSTTATTTTATTFESNGNKPLPFGYSQVFASSSSSTSSSSSSSSSSSVITPYVPSGLTAEEYQRIKQREAAVHASKQYGAWGPRFARTPGCPPQGDWFLLPQLWTTGSVVVPTTTTSPVSGKSKLDSQAETNNQRFLPFQFLGKYGTPSLAFLWSFVWIHLVFPLILRGMQQTLLRPSLRILPAQPLPSWLLLSSWPRQSFVVALALTWPVQRLVLFRGDGNNRRSPWSVVTRSILLSLLGYLMYSFLISTGVGSKLFLLIRK